MFVVVTIANIPISTSNPSSIYNAVEQLKVRYGNIKSAEY